VEIYPLPGGPGREFFPQWIHPNGFRKVYSGKSIPGGLFGKSIREVYSGSLLECIVLFSLMRGAERLAGSQRIKMADRIFIRRGRVSDQLDHA
jgi:hypothetical protein